MDKSNFYYRCAERIYKFPLEKKCQSPGINAVVLDTFFWKELLKLLTDPALLRRHAEEWLKSQVSGNSDGRERQKLLASIAKLEEEKMRYAKAYGTGTLEFEAFKGLVSEIDHKKHSCQKQMEELEKQGSPAGIAGVSLERLCEEAKRVLSLLDLTDKIKTVKDLVEKVVVYGGREVEVMGRIPLPALNMGLYAISRNCRSAERR